MYDGTEAQLRGWLIVDLTLLRKVSKKPSNGNESKQARTISRVQTDVQAGVSFLERSKTLV
jgi:hypothetical protein